MSTDTILLEKGVHCSLGSWLDGVSRVEPDREPASSLQLPRRLPTRGLSAMRTVDELLLVKIRHLVDY